MAMSTGARAISKRTKTNAVSDLEKALTKRGDSGIKSYSTGKKGDQRSVVGDQKNNPELRLRPLASDF
jgi:hypothetical protein